MAGMQTIHSLDWKKPVKPLVGLSLVGKTSSPWLPTILAAAEIHGKDSSFALLVDSLDIDRSVRLYLHRYARPAMASSGRRIFGPLHYIFLRHI
jgi:hypothetical protein